MSSAALSEKFCWSTIADSRSGNYESYIQSTCGTIEEKQGIENQWHSTNIMLIFVCILNEIFGGLAYRCYIRNGHMHLHDIRQGEYNWDHGTRWIQHIFDISYLQTYKQSWEIITEKISVSGDIKSQGMPSYLFDIFSNLISLL